jgi:secreted protein with Ig-like and vWFA domain
MSDHEASILPQTKWAQVSDKFKFWAKNLQTAITFIPKWHAKNAWMPNV